MFTFQKLALFSRNLLHLTKAVRKSENVVKFSRIPYSLEFLIAGCCFSRQSDEEILIAEDRNEHENSPKLVNKDCIHSDRNAADSENMKRSFESIDNVGDSSSKRKKSDDIGPCQDDNEEQKLLNIEYDPPAEASSEQPKVHHEKPSPTAEKPKKQRPNYFVAVKISDEQIHHTLTELQAHIVQKDERLKKSMIELKTLHITLMVMYIGDTDTHSRALKALECVHHEHDEDMSKNPVKLEFQGLGHFQNRVLFAKLSMDDSYERLCLLAESVKKHFASVSIPSTDSRKGFTPHLTVAKIDFKKKRNKSVKKIDPSLYKDFNDQYFGSQKIASIQLLSMTDPKDEVGYYSGNEIYFSAFEPSVRRDSLSKMLETEKKKKNVKEMINALMKEKLK